MNDLNKSQLILLALLISFVTSIATGISAVTLMQQAPTSFTTPINRIVRQTIEKVVQVDNSRSTPPLTEDQKKLLEDLKAIKPLTVSLFLKGTKEDGSEDKILGTGLFLGEDKVVIASLIDQPKEGEVYVIKSVLGEQKISKVVTEKDFTVIELSLTEPLPPPPPVDTSTDHSNLPSEQ